MLHRMRALRMGDGEEPTAAVRGYRGRAEARLRAMRQGPMALSNRGRGGQQPDDEMDHEAYLRQLRGEPPRPASPLLSSDDEADADVARRDEAAREQAREQALLPETTHEEEDSFGFGDEAPEDDDEARMRGYHTMFVDELDPLARRDGYEPRPGTPQVDEDETERARQAGIREWFADFAAMHVEHYREGTMTWEELVEELRDAAASQ
jgi:hypothetical protein